MRASVQRFFDRFYPVDQEGRRYLDATTPFYEWIHDHADSDAEVLNLGAGPTPREPVRKMRGTVKRLVGVDPDSIVLENEDLDEAHVNDGVRLAFPDGSFHLVYSDWVAEHVAKPSDFLQEVHRVLKPGGSYMFRTVNLLHYAPFISYMTPHWFHRLVANRVRSLDAGSHEPWSTVYEMNSPSRIRQLSKAAGFDSCEVRLMESHPSYLMFHPVPFLIGVGYERLVNRFEWLAAFRSTLYVKLTKFA